MILLSLLISAAFAGPHDHHNLRSSVEEATQVVSGPLSVKPDNCPASEERAYVNFDPKHLKDEEGFHGMLFFGSDTIYISHLPMFHEPHDYQAIVEVKLPPAEKAKYLAAAKGYKGYFTFAPDGNFVLPKKITEKGKIKGKLVKGHFERGGTELLEVELDIVRVVFYKKISASEKRPEKERYAIFGDGKEYFSAHVVSQRPGVDEIFPVPVLPAEMKKDINAKGTLVTDQVEVKKDKVSVGSSSFPYKEFYRETGDLE